MDLSPILFIHTWRWFLHSVQVLGVFDSSGRVASYFHFRSTFSSSLFLFVSFSQTGWYTNSLETRSKQTKRRKIHSAKFGENFQPKFSAGKFIRPVNSESSPNMEHRGEWNARFAAVQSILSEPGRHSHARCTAVNPVLSKNEKFPARKSRFENWRITVEKSATFFPPPPAEIHLQWKLSSEGGSKCAGNGARCKYKYPRGRTPRGISGRNPRGIVLGDVHFG